MQRESFTRRRKKAKQKKKEKKKWRGRQKPQFRRIEGLRLHDAVFFLVVLFFYCFFIQYTLRDLKEEQQQHPLERKRGREGEKEHRLLFFILLASLQCSVLSFSVFSFCFLHIHLAFSCCMNTEKRLRCMYVYSVRGALLPTLVL